MSSERTYQKEFGTIFPYELFRTVYVSVSKSTAHQQAKCSREPEEVAWVVRVKGKLVMGNVWFFDVDGRVHHCVVGRWRRNMLSPLRQSFDCLRSRLSLGRL